jgi:hypothetical protein
MLKRACVFVLLLAAGACSGGDGITTTTTTSPSNSPTASRSTSAIPSPSTTSPPPTPTSGTITFNGLAALADGSAVSTYTELGFTVLATPGSWMAETYYGNPGPSLTFKSPGGTVQVTAGGAAFGFTSIDLYSSTTTVPYTITGLRNSKTAFTLANTLPNTFGNFVTVTNPQAAVMVDTLVINLTNSAPGVNPIGVDNVAVSK